jgi:predicted nucleic acid-binding protein
LIAYLDTSALVPLLIDEPASPIWLGRLTRSDQRTAIALLEET